jgi:hypothetical protein
LAVGFFGSQRPSRRCQQTLLREKGGKFSTRKKLRSSLNKLRWTKKGVFLVSFYLFQVDQTAALPSVAACVGFARWALTAIGGGALFSVFILSLFILNLLKYR